MPMIVRDEAKDGLQQAIREIRVFAGLNAPDGRTFPSLRGDERRSLSRTLVALPSRALKGPKGSAGALETNATDRYVVDGQGETEDAEVPPAHPPLTIGITSGSPGEGKSMLAMALASSLCADFGTHVTLVDADFETHSIGREYGLDGREGLAEVLSGQSELPAVTNHFTRAPLSVITAGVATVDSGRLAHSDRLPEALGQLKQKSRFVVLDLPSTLGSMNAPAIAEHCDGVIVVARARATNRRDLERTLRVLGRANVLGVVLNRRESKIPDWIERLLDLEP